MFLSLGIGATVALTMISVVSYFTKTPTSGTTTTTLLPTPAIVGHRVPVRSLAGLPGFGARHDVPQRGRPTVEVFFASWCGPCRAEMPKVATWYANKPNNVDFVAIASNDDPSAAANFLRDVKVSLPVVQDSNGTITSNDYGFATLPETVFVDSTGVVRKVIFGAVTVSELRQGAASLR